MSLLTIFILFISAITLTITKQSHFAKYAFIGGDDSDMKIAAPFPSRQEPSKDAAEEGAAQFLKNKDNGNIEKAREAGGILARELLRFDSIIADFSQNNDIWMYSKVLFSYAAINAIELFTPNSTVAYTVRSSLYDTISDKSLVVYDKVNDSAVFSLFIIAGKDPDKIAKVFAKICGEERNASFVEFGEKLYEKYYLQSKEILLQMQFVATE